RHRLHLHAFPTRRSSDLVQVGEGRRRGRVRVVIGGNVDRLHRRDGVTTRRGDAFLQQTHLVSQVGLIAHGRGHATQQGRDLGTGDRKSTRLNFSHVSISY